MPSTLHTHDLILRMKRKAQEQHLSPKNIYDMLESEGMHVCLNSIKRVFAEGSEHEHFRFKDTIQPLSSLLLDIEGEETGDLEVDGLKAMLKVKKELIEKLEHDLAISKEASGQRIDFLVQQIKLKDERIDRLMSRVDEVLATNSKLLSQIQVLIEKLHIE